MSIDEIDPHADPQACIEMAVYGVFSAIQQLVELAKQEQPRGLMVKERADILLCAGRLNSLSDMLRIAEKEAA